MFATGLLPGLYGLSEMIRGSRMFEVTILRFTTADFRLRIAERSIDGTRAQANRQRYQRLVTMAILCAGPHFSRIPCARGEHPAAT
jgi:hypothetical protein